MLGESMDLDTGTDTGSAAIQAVRLACILHGTGVGWKARTSNAFVEDAWMTMHGV